jgi:hypothetical protein
MSTELDDTTGGPQSTKLGVSTETKLFAWVSAFTFVIFIIYAVSSDDDSGKILLLITTSFSGIVAAYLYFRDRRGGVAVEAGPPTEVEEIWFAESSLWPLGIAGGGALVAAGLALGPWVWLPGSLLLVRSLWGLVIQSRDRG